MSDPAKIFIASTGIITPVGGNSKMTVAAVNAGLSAYCDSYNLNKSFNPMRMALIPEDALPPLHEELEGLAELTARQRRMLRIATPALQEVMDVGELKRAPPLFLAVPESFPGYDTGIHANFLDHLLLQTGVNFDRASSRLIATGRAGSIEVIDWAFKYMQSTGRELVLVGGIDSHMDLLLLGELDKQNRILADSISDGFAPGEGAGFLLLVSERVVGLFPRDTLTAVYMPGLANEPGHRYSEEPYRGDGLSAAFQEAIKNSGGEKIEAIYASLNGESFGTKEFGVASIRNKSALVENVESLHPADCFGDLGAAFGPVLVAMASAAKYKASLCYCSAEQGARAAVVVAAV